MEPGDLIAYIPNEENKKVLSHVISFLSRFIGGSWKPKGKSFSHVGIVSEFEGDIMYESTFPKSRTSPIFKKGYDVYTIPMYFTDEQSYNVIRKCEKMNGRWYDYIALITGGLIKMKKRSVCSEYVSTAYRRAGLKLFEKDEFIVSPNELIDRLTNMGYSLKRINKEQ